MKGHSIYTGPLKTVSRTAREWAIEKKHIEVAESIERWENADENLLRQIKVRHS